MEGRRAEARGRRVARKRRAGRASKAQHGPARAETSGAYREVRREPALARRAERSRRERLGWTTHTKRAGRGRRDARADGAEKAGGVAETRRPRARAGRDRRASRPRSRPFPRRVRDESEQKKCVESAFVDRVRPFARRNATPEALRRRVARRARGGRDRARSVFRRGAVSGSRGVAGRLRRDLRQAARARQVLPGVPRERRAELGHVAGEPGGGNQEVAPGEGRGFRLARHARHRLPRAPGPRQTRAAPRRAGRRGVARRARRSRARRRGPDAGPRGGGVRGARGGRPGGRRRARARGSAWRKKRSASGRGRDGEERARGACAFRPGRDEEAPASLEGGVRRDARRFCFRPAIRAPRVGIAGRFCESLARRVVGRRARKARGDKRVLRARAPRGRRLRRKRARVRARGGDAARARAARQPGDGGRG